ncbi:MAG: hypothetical protein KY447_01690, partial [Actinobacteria bacterium]|nr:hypothetical protein [Actinomycetota bacterium]
ATRVDPLRPENPDFDIVGPGWLSVVTFSLAVVLHGMAVAAFANRYSTTLPPKASGRAERIRTFAPVALPALMLVPGAALLIFISVGLVITVLLSQVTPLVSALRSRASVVAGRAVLAVVVLALLPGSLTDLRDVVVRDGSATSSAR